MPRQTADAWDSIRAEREAGASFGDLASRYDVSKPAIVRRAKNERWDIGGDGTESRHDLVMIGAVKKLGLTPQGVLSDISKAEARLRESIEYAKRNYVAYVRDAYIALERAFHKGHMAHLEAMLDIAIRYGRTAPTERITRNDKAREDTTTIVRANLRSRASTAMMRSLKKGEGQERFFKLFGYRPEKLIRRLKRNMPAGYTWDDFISAELHLDHIVPLSVFNFDSVDQLDFYRAWHYTNLQLLPARENIKKSAKLFQPFQPALAL